MKKLVPLALASAALLVPASSAQAAPGKPNYGQCLKLVAQQAEGLTPSEFNELFNPPKSNGDRPGVPVTCLVTSG